MFVLRSFHLLARVQRLYVTEFMVDLFSSFLFMPFATVIYLFLFTMIVHRARRKTLMFFLFFFSFLHFMQMMSSEHLTCGWLQQLLLVLVKLGFTFAGPLRPLIGTECTAKSPASYILVFTGHWSPQAFPKQYPLFRPPAQWSKLIGEKDPWGWKHGLLENHPC